MEICEVKNVRIGEGLPKVCVPITSATHYDIIDRFNKLNNKDIDLIEFRIDYFEELNNQNSIDNLFKTIKSLNIVKPIIFTCRTLKEGGKADIEKPAYKDLYLKAIESKAFDIFDIELNLGANMLIDLEEACHSNDMKILISFHDFDMTNQRDSIIQKFDQMESYKADIYKIAMMPENINDVLSVLEISDYASKEYKKPIVAISMSKIGIATRLLGETIGSAITFGCDGDCSAPGQIDYKDLKTVLNIVHKAIKD
ncbi:MAG: type I 3-dehydroquinate dehydratase [Thomasclavelia sp.]|nr:type I 3-dehydroquinate dehydratase [Thomasclavelia sp.]